MNVILPIHKPYTDRIFNGRKPFEFRNRIPKLEKYDKVFVYETKKNGCGMVVGYFTVKSVEEIVHSKLGAYQYVSEYAHIYYNKEIQRLVDKAMTIKLKDCANDLVLCYIFMEDCLDEMLRTNRPPGESFNNLLYKDIKNYQEIKEKQNTFIQGCDNWLSDMGYYNAEEGNKSEWKYRIRIAGTCQYENPKPITEFLNRKGKIIEKAPQGFCYTTNN